jgi:hypothetical protein
VELLRVNIEASYIYNKHCMTRSSSCNKLEPY